MVRIMITGLVKLGILHGDVDQLIADNAQRPFFMHGLSHWLGLDVHDVGVYGRALAYPRTGMVLTVEPDCISRRTPTYHRLIAELAFVLKMTS